MYNNILKISFKYVQHSKFCILGGGTGGINTAAHLMRQNDIKANEIRIFEPSQYHYYQPGWTMVGNNLVEADLTRKLTESVIP